MKRKWSGIHRIFLSLIAMFFLFGVSGVSAAAKEIGACQVTLSQDLFTYSGAVCGPKVTVKDGGSTLTEGIDYTIYGATAYTVGRHEIIIVGQGSYSGRTSAVFEIGKAKNEIKLYQSVFETYADKKLYKLDGSAKGNAKLTYSTTTKGVSITKDGWLTAKEGFLGTAKILVTAEETELYQKASAVFSVKFKLKGTSITSVKSEGTIKDMLPDNDHTVKVSWITDNLNGMDSADGFRIRFSTDPTFKTKVHFTKVPMFKFLGDIVSSCTMSKNLVKGTKVYFQIGLYKKALDNKTYYSSWSKAVSHKVDSSAKAFYKGKKPKNGEIYTEDGVKYQYKNKKLTAIGCSYLNKDKHIVIANSLSIFGVNYPVTAIKAAAFSSAKVPGVPKKITIGKNVTTIGASAFSGQSFVSSIVIKSTKLKTGSVGKYAFRNVGYYSTTFFGQTYTQTYTVKIQIPKSRKVSYKRLLGESGIKGKIIWR